MREFGWFVVIAGVVIVEMATAPGTPFNGNAWRLSRSSSPGMVQLTLERSRMGSRSMNSSTVPLSNFRGFTLDNLDHSGPAKFEYQHDVGKLACEGRFAWGRGSGSFTLTPNPDFVAQLNRLGFETPDDDDLYFMILANVNLDYARAIQEAGIGASLRQLIEMRQHGITEKYIHEISQSGYANLRAQDYIELKDHGVDSSFLRHLKSAGYDLRAGDIVELRMHGVSSEFADELKQAGYNLSSGQITDLAMHGVNSDFVRELKFRSLRPSSQDMVQLRMHGVTPDYLRGLRDAGYDNLSADEVCDLVQHGVPSDFILAAHDLGYRFTPRELIDLRMHGVDARYLKNLKDSGMPNLSEPQITQLRMHGVE